MTRRRDLLQHLDQLGEIRQIMNAMKNLALRETRKLGRYLDTQHQVVGVIEDVAADLLSYHPDIIANSDHPATRAVLLIGTERGFCGDFNKSLVDALSTAEAQQPFSTDADPVLLAVGHKLCTRLEGDPRLAVSLAGPNVAEEVPDVLNRLIHQLEALQSRYPTLSLTALYHDAGTDQIIHKPLLPPFQSNRPQRPRYACPPQLNLTPPVLLTELIDHYVLAVLHEIFYVSLAAENHQRIEHMEGAVTRLDDQTLTLKRRANVLRQEEITEEIEVILLSAENPTGSSRGGRPNRIRNFRAE
jgi:F-type H+-transporting ATPase subunit gamma